MVNSMEMTVLEFIAVCLSWFCGGIAVKRCIDTCRKHSTKKEVIIKGWVARDKSGIACLYKRKPARFPEYWSGGYVASLPEDYFPEVTWESNPKKVKVTIEEE